MDWNKELICNLEYGEIKNKEQKEEVVKKIVDKAQNGDVIGFGSGSTAYLAICAIAEKIKRENIEITAIPTSYEVEMLCASLGIKTASLLEKKPDWSFDGADEVNDKNWLIKGRGGAMFREKLNIANSKITYILVDESKLVDKLGINFKIPVECYPESVNYVKEKLLEIGAEKVSIRRAISKDGPIITENKNIILDVKFRKYFRIFRKRH